MCRGLEPGAAVVLLSSTGLPDRQALDARWGGAPVRRLPGLREAANRSRSHAFKERPWAAAAVCSTAVDFTQQFDTEAGSWAVTARLPEGSAPRRAVVWCRQCTSPSGEALADGPVAEAAVVQTGGVAASGTVVLLLCGVAWDPTAGHSARALMQSTVRPT